MNEFDKISPLTSFQEFSRKFSTVLSVIIYTTLFIKDSSNVYKYFQTRDIKSVDKTTSFENKAIFRFVSSDSAISAGHRARVKSGTLTTFETQPEMQSARCFQTAEKVFRKQNKRRLKISQNKLRRRFFQKKNIRFIELKSNFLCKSTNFAPFISTSHAQIMLISYITMTQVGMLVGW